MNKRHVSPSPPFAKKKILVIERWTDRGRGGGRKKEGERTGGRKKGSSRGERNVK